MTKDQFERLPKYAQEFIKRKNREVNELFEKLEAYQKGHPDSEVKLLDFYDGRFTKTGLPERAIIAFDVGGREYMVTVRDGKLDVRTESGTVLMEPVAANVVRFM